MQGLRRLGLILILCLTAAAASATAEEIPEKAAADVEQSVAPDAAGADDSATCGNGGSCCTACQVRQKYAKEKAAAGDGEGGCPCQRAKRERERAAAAAAAAAAQPD